jgi:hypothetical protein
MDWNELQLEPCHVGVPLGASLTIFEPMVRLVHIVHLNCTDTNTASKQTEMKFHMTHSRWSSIRYVQDNFRAYGTFGQNRASILHRH